jgi:hypothetical protein
MKNGAVQLMGLGLAAVLTFLTIYRILGGREKTPRNIPRPTPSGLSEAAAAPTVDVSSAVTTAATAPSPVYVSPTAQPASDPPSTVR